VLSALPTLDLALWAATTLVTVVLLCLILARRLDQKFPFLTAYLGVNLLQTLAQVVVYEIYGIRSNVTYAAVWGSQAVVILARAFATGEFCYALLGRYLGVWALAKRILAAFERDRTGIEHLFRQRRIPLWRDDPGDSL
jgi:hypothetical protein